MDERTYQMMKLFLTLHYQLLVIIVIWQFEQNKRWRNRRWLVRPLNQNRLTRGYFYTTFQELKRDDDLFFNITRMNLATFDLLLRKLTPYLKKASNISPEERLAITLRFLSTGDKISTIAIEFRIGFTTCYNIIKETADVIYRQLAPDYVKIPSEQEWKNISLGFLHEWNLPNCIGAIDGKHVYIRKPYNSCALFYNYKKSFSIVLMAICNYKYEFTLFDVGALGSETDGGILARSKLGEFMREKKLNIPEELNRLPGSDVQVPYYFVADDAFELAPTIMKPYSGGLLSTKEKIFNYRVSRARRVIENTFGILVSRWRFLDSSVGLQPPAVVACVLAAICLHNFLMKISNTMRNVYCPPGYLADDLRRTQRYSLREPDILNIHNDALRGKFIRNQLSDYFLTSSGEVPWQEAYVSRGLNR